MFRRIFSKKNRVLVSELVRTDFKLRYQGSVLGYTWSLLRPLLIFAILYVVFIKFLHVNYDVPHSAVYLLIGIVIWNFFNEMTVLSLGSIVGRADLIRKIRIPRWIIIFSTSISTVINLLLNLIVIAIFMVLNHVSLSSTALLLPLILLEVYIIGLGFSLFLSAAFVKYRDVSYIWEVIMQAGFYLTPLLYPISRLPSLTIKKLVLLNPMGQAIQDARYSLITHKTLTTHRIFNGGWHSLIPFALVLLSLIVGAAYFKSQANGFAENL